MCHAYQNHATIMRLGQTFDSVHKRIKKHTFAGDDGEEYKGSAFDGFTDYVRRKRTNLQNLYANRKSQATTIITSSKAADASRKGEASATQLEVVQSQETKYDNFYTPQNQSFYNQFEYVKLNPKERHIRLLRIHPIRAGEDDSATIRCDVVDDLPLASMEERFTTLSYCAGNPNRTESILVNSIGFNAFANLGHALRQVRHYWSKNRNGEELLLWADQVCIDQSNSNERSHQVNFMGDIYAAAEQVLICLSAEGSLSGGFEWLKSAYESIGRLGNSGEEFSPQQFIDLNCSNENLHQGFDAFIQTCLTSPWFKRAWVRQEFFKSREAVFLATFEAVSLIDLSTWTLVLFFGIIQSKSFSEYWLSRPERCSASTSDCSLCRLLKDPSYFYHDWYSVMRFLNLKGNHSEDLMENLLEAYVCQTSDQRDLIYAFLGFSVECYHIFPNYDPSVSYVSLCTQLARNYLRHTGNLDLLVKAYTRTVDWASRDPIIPSWVPDWRVRETHGLKSFISERKAHRVSKTEFTFQRCGDGNAQKILTTRGLLLLSLDGRTFHEDMSLYKIDWGSNYWTKMGSVKVWGSSHEGDEVWILSGASQAFTFRRKGQYHELRGEMTFLQPPDRPAESIGDAITMRAVNDQNYEYHYSQMGSLVEKVNRLVEENDPSIQVIHIC
ncbi:heterokaryon incompatibility protein-domain-containing protein [Paraphoma chrysanthemicola]|nr:heterokaryon incompatibility protein-domain-containing protein [Paraphoma chrysanthemicola]